MSRRVGGKTGRVALGLLLLAAASCAIPRWPVEGPISSPFGVRWSGLLPDLHRGVDISVPEGTSVRAMAPGVVRFAGTMAGYGQVVWLEHGGSVLSVYAHLSRVDVTAGQRMEARQIVGLSGSTGNVTGAHLHFEVWRWGREADPVPLLGGPPGS